MDNGLTVVLNATASDYFYSLHSTVGFIIIIHNSQNYPDETNGNYRQFILPPNTEAFLKLDTRTVKTNTDVTKFSIDKVTTINQLYMCYK